MAFKSPAGHLAWARARRRNRGGSALLLALFFLVALFFLARAFQVLIPQEMRAALRMATDTQASLMADAGIQKTMAWIEFELSNGREIASVTTRPGW